jgi:hypothetical protein
MTALEDGIYDVIVVDVSQIDDGAFYIELALSSSAHRGEMVNVTARHLQREPLSLLGLSATLVVTDGRPRIEWE